MTKTMAEHISVMLDESVDMLVTDKNGLYVDGTFGRGGHTRLVLERLEAGRLLGFDKDPVTSLIIEAKKISFKKIKSKNNINFSKKNYNNYAFSLLYNKETKKNLKQKNIKF